METLIQKKFITVEEAHEIDAAALKGVEEANKVLPEIHERLLAEQAQAERPVPRLRLVPKDEPDKPV